MQNIDPDTIPFDDEELEILEAYKNGKLENQPVSDRLILAAQETLKKNKNINIRITDNDLTSIKLIAAKQGIPYQTLIGSLIHKYNSGILKEVA
jgi:predicted DNA binding CopG/RHH family protein